MPVIRAMDAKPRYVLQGPLEPLPDHVHTEDTKSLVLHEDTQVLTDGVTTHAPEMQGSRWPGIGPGQWS